jgi:CelD/BcsL family acetyltransferase involved in cellulose biosynthesis
VYRITLTPAGDLTTLGRRWQALEQDADPGFFRSWTFLGCQGEARFAGARLLSVTQDGADVALALLGRRRRRSWLNQTGCSAQDAPFIEHNGLLVRSGQEEAIAPAFAYVLRRAGPLVLSGISDATCAAARDAGWLHIQQSRFAPCAALDGLNRPYIDTLSANARAQIRRSQRLYGPELRLSRAQSVNQAQSFFTELMERHQASWQARGKPGAFAGTVMVEFHRTLIARAWPLGQADLLRVSAGEAAIGLLYNLILRGRVYSYQSGFAYSEDARIKPGLVSHALAIQHYASLGYQAYDLLAGPDRYKLTLAAGGETLHWGTLYGRSSALGVMARVRGKIKHDVLS